MATAPKLVEPPFRAWSAAGFGAELLPLCAWDDVSVAIDRRGKKPIPTGWSELKVTPDLLATWSRQRVNVGLRTRYFPAIDIDVDAEAIAAAVEDVAVRVLGKTARRTRANSPRRALLCRLAGEPFAKAKLEFLLPDGEEAKVEILADGQQLAVAGIHSSGVDLAWDELPVAANLAELSALRRDALLGVIRVRLLELGCTMKAREVEAPAPREPMPQVSKSWSDDAELAALALRNLDPDMDYEGWIRVGMALHAKDPSIGGPAFCAWDEWSRRSEGKYQGTRDLENHWRSFKTGNGVGFATLLAMAKVSPRDVRPKLTAVPSPKPEPEAPEAKQGIPLIRACDATEKPVDWLIENFLARGELTDLSGDPGVGKGGITASWAARVTREDPKATVIFFATEDPLGRVKARLRAEGADLSRVFFLDITKENASPILPGDTHQVEELVRKHNAALLILDPALEFMQADLDSHKQQDVARFMGPLLGIAMRTGASLLTVRHNNKNSGASALHRASGSIGFTGKVRIALLASKNAETKARALAVTKNNLGPDKHTVGYEIVSRDGASVVAWGEVLTISADELVNQEPAKKKRGPSPAKLEAAIDALRSMLRTGPMKVDDVLRQARAEGFSQTTVYEAKTALRVQKITVEMRSAWRLPENETPEFADSQLRETPENSGK